MGISFRLGNFTDGGAASISTITCDFATNLVGSLIVVSFGFVDAPGTITANTPTDTIGNTYFAAAPKARNNTQQFAIYTFYAFNSKPSAVTNTVTFTLTGGPTTFLRAHIQEYVSNNGIFATDPFDKTSAAVGNSTALDSGAQVTTQPHELIFGFGACGSGSISAGTNFTLREPSGGGSSTGSVDFNQKDPASISAVATASVSSQWVMQMATFKDVVAVGIQPQIYDPGLLQELILRQQSLWSSSPSVAAGPDQTVLPSGITTSEAFGTPVISLTVSASGIPTSEAFGSPAISRTVSASSIPTQEAFGKPTISLSVTPSGITSSEAFGSPSISLVVSASGITSGEALGSPTITTTVTVNANGIPSSEAFGSANIATATVITPSGIPSAEAFGSPSIALTVSPSGIPSSEAFGKPTISLTVNPSAITSAEAFGSPSIQVITAINASGIPSSEAFGSPTITTTVTVQASGIPTAERFGSPTITTMATIQASGIPSSEAFGKPSITTGPVTVQASGIPSSEAFGAAQVSLGALVLTVQAAGIPSSEAFGAPFVGVVVQIDITVVVKVDTIVWRADPDLASPVVIPGIVSRADDVIIAPVGPDVI